MSELATTLYDEEVLHGDEVPEPLKKTNTDIPLVHNVCDRIGTGLQQSFE